MKDLLDAFGFHQLFEQRSLALPTGNPNATDTVLVIADLNQAEAVAAMNQAHGLGINRQSLCFFVMCEPLRAEIPVKHCEVGG